MRFPGFVGPAYQSPNPISTSEVLLNLYVEKNETPGAKSPFDLVCTPGFEEFLLMPQSPSRGMFAQDGRCFAVNGSDFSEVFSTGTSTSRGTVALGSAPASFASSGDAGQELFFISGRQGYVFNLASVAALATPVSGVDFAGYLDGYFIALDALTSTLYISDLLDGATAWTIPGAQREGAGDRWVSMLVTHQDIWLFGSETFEVWVNQGLSPFPFALNPSAVGQQGTGAPLSVALLRNTPVWLAQSGQGGGVVLMAQGYGDPRRISTHALEHAMEGYDTIADAEAFSYEAAGHAFYVLTFPSADVTWVYDVSTDSWHQRGFLLNGVIGAYRPNCHVYAFGKHLVGDRDGSSIWEMRPDVYTDIDEEPIRRVRRAPHLDRFVFEVAVSDPVPVRICDAYIDVRPGFRSLTCDRFALDMQVGVGLTSGQGVDPQVMLRVSLDGGLTFGSELMRSAGAIGAYNTIVEWHRLGAIRTAA